MTWIESSFLSRCDAFHINTDDTRPPFVKMTSGMSLVRQICLKWNLIFIHLNFLTHNWEGRQSLHGQKHRKRNKVEKNHHTCHPHMLQAPKDVSVIWRLSFSLREGQRYMPAMTEIKAISLVFHSVESKWVTVWCTKISTWVHFSRILSLYICCTTSVQWLEDAYVVASLWRWCFDRESSAFTTRK